LQGILQNSKRDEKTDAILKFSDNSKWFDGTLMKDNLLENLGRFVAHKQSISEGLET
jgi:hypothetical protein